MALRLNLTVAAACHNHIPKRLYNTHPTVSAKGPWSDEMLAFTALQPTGGDIVHDAQAHPEYNVDGGRIMFVSYSRSTASFSSEVRIVSLTPQPR